MKLICSALLALIATDALAGGETKTLAYSKETAAAMIAAACEGKAEPTSTAGADGSVNHAYDASTEDLHRCQFIVEVSASGCVQAGSCKGYEDWARANPAISPSLPRQAFLSALEARKAASHPEDN
ncbi:hypothetical protein EGJ28_15910 [Stutzerimonas xanthomarina]|jgi:hypothetical protein|uniref:Lipoprotein n=1 Tax=Stutzerimonas xanthomarina TaxID=271420 RepID=A0A3R8V571_9GAMM|nr:hypothetical protein [Stutzerimonas xanthomarina]RRV08757.1 hypothetical protein EGJ28_15910 [Stutzerimonas xanthomarina]